MRPPSQMPGADRPATSQSRVAMSHEAPGGVRSSRAPTALADATDQEIGTYRGGAETPPSPAPATAAATVSRISSRFRRQSRILRFGACL